jgi:hypothetical protein
MSPYALAAREGLRTELPRMGEYHARAVAIAEALRALPGVAVSADPPAGNAFAVYLDGERGALLAARDAVAERDGLTVFENLAPTPHPRIWSFELAVGPNTMELGVREIRDAIAALAEVAAMR